MLIGASMIAGGLILLAGAAGRWLTFAPPEQLYIAAQLIIVAGVVLQDVVADAMSTEVVPRVLPDGSPRPKTDIDRDLGMVQILGRLALSLGAFLVAGLGGWLAKVYSYETVFLIALVIPMISASGALLVKLETSETRDTDWRILGGGLMFGLTVTLLALLDAPFNQELVFLISLAVVVAMLARITAGISRETRLAILYAALIIFAFRATPTVGEGFRWFTIDVLGFDEAFYGMLAQIGAGIALAAAWLLSDAITRKPVATVLLWLTLLGGLLSIPTLALVRPGRPLDRSHVRLRRQNHRDRGFGSRLALGAAQHGAAADAHRGLCAAGSPGDVVRAHGLFHEPRPRGGPARDQVPEQAVRGRTRELCRASRARHYSFDIGARDSARGAGRLRPPDPIGRAAARKGEKACPRHHVRRRIELPKCAAP